MNRKELMNRKQRRQLEREQSKEAAQFNSQSKWLDNLLPWQKAVIDTMLREVKVDAEIECIEAVDKILTGVLIERTDMTWKETFDFNTAFGKYYAEYRFVTSKIGKEKRLKMLQELEKEVISKVESLIIEGKSRGQIVKNLMSDYKEKVGLTTPEANNVYKRTYEKYKLYIKEIETEVIKSIIGHLENNQKSEGIINLIKIEYPKISENDIRGMYIIAKEEFMKPKYEDYSNVPYVGNDNVKKQGRKAKKDTSEIVSNKSEEKADNEAINVEYNDIKEEVKEEKKDMGNLKVVKEIVKVVSRELEGEFGKYIADENGVTREGLNFKDLAAVEEYKKREIERFEREIAELEAVFTFREN